MVSKACLVGAYQTKLEAIAQFEDVELAVVVPPVWQDPAGPVFLERSHTNGYQLLVDPIRLNGQFHLHYYPRLKRRLAQFRPDILHMDEEPYNLATWLGVRQAQAMQIKSLFFTWQNIYQKYPLPFNFMEKQVLSAVRYAIMGNEAAVQVWQAKGYRGPHEVIPQFGVCPDIYRPPAHRDNGRGFTIGAAGRRLVPEKGVDLLLQAAARLPGVWRVHVAGEGPEKPALERLARQLGIGDRVYFDGVIPSGQMPAYLGQLDVVVLPSRTLPNWKEQFGRVLIEAMACETAVVGSDSGEIPHVIGQAGLIFPEGNVQALHGHLLRLMQEEALRQEMARAGRQRVLAHYTQAQVAARTVEIYREIMNAGSRSSKYE
ncbi:MAG: glycosyltransferase family 4 protein [Chloroflexi bacterium]|nr:glycosyltransferase family 4 protein [Chloroflexota bacterium]MCI0579228.1 glycosyltransferase family 4 protein [Chloroflexota bacterium]MCI0650046.1 glycosyltransferase family 4 protein [Chloroflexota bacterium]MCI0728831.1 glycosyltransferase family 4 protein [Chloroflexota bacterium]